MRKFYRLAASAVMLLAASLFAPVAMACHDNSHESACDTTAAGVPLAPVKHDAVAPLLAHADDVIALARLEMKDSTLSGTKRAEFAKVLAFTEEARRTTRWSWIGTVLFMGDPISTDTNPWHVAYHGLARGTQDLAMRMNAFDGANPPIMTVYNAINQASGFSLVNCLASFTAFNTAQPVATNWSHQRENLGTLAMGFVLLLLGTGIIATLFVVERKRKGGVPHIPLIGMNLADVVKR